MPRETHPVVLTANHLTEGDAIWWTGCGWTRDIAAAALFPTAEEAPLAQAGAHPDGVGAYAVAVDAARRPVLRREAIRADREPSFAYLPDSRDREAA
jgi:hypothetical protein